MDVFRIPCLGFPLPSQRLRGLSSGLVLLSRVLVARKNRGMEVWHVIAIQMYVWLADKVIVCVQFRAICGYS
jgi:hypothetical protein